MAYTIEEDELQDLKGKMMHNPNLFTAGLIVAKTELALDAQSQLFKDREEELIEENIDNKLTWKHRYDLIDWIENIAKDFVAGYTIEKTSDLIKITIERTKHNMSYGEFPYIKKGTYFYYAGEHYKCELFEHKLITGVATVLLELTKKENKNEEN